MLQNVNINFVCGIEFDQKSARLNFELRYKSILENMQNHLIPTLQVQNFQYRYFPFRNICICALHTLVRSFIRPFIPLMYEPQTKPGFQSKVTCLNSTQNIERFMQNIMQPQIIENLNVNNTVNPFTSRCSHLLGHACSNY